MFEDYIPRRSHPCHNGIASYYYGNGCIIMILRNIARAVVIAAALAIPTSAWAAVTTTAVAAGTADWADLGIPSAGSVMIVQPTSADIIFAIADVKPGITPAVGFHLDPKVLTQVTL